jgi:hypothetical protein
MKFENLFQKILNTDVKFASEMVGLNTFTNQHAEDLLKEGLDVSYGTENLKKAIYSKFREDILHSENVPPFKETKTKYGDVFSVAFIFNKDFDLTNLDPILKTYGYFVSKTNPKFEFKDQEALFCRLEAKFPLEIVLPEKDVSLIHVTLKDKLKKILKNGLTPKESQTTFGHDGNRICLLATICPEEDVNSLKRILANSKEVSENDMIAFEIFPNQWKNRKYYIDESFLHKQGQHYSIFTFTNFSPREIRLWAEQH